MDLIVAVMGHVDHGKTTFTSSLTKMAEFFYPEYNSALGFAQIDNAKEEKARGITINASHVPIRFKDRIVSITDCPGHRDYINNMISGSSQADIGILVIHSGIGIAPQTLEHVKISRSLGINNVVIVYNQIDTTEDLELVEMEVKDLIEEYNLNLLMDVRVNSLKPEEYSDQYKNLLSLLETYTNVSDDTLQQDFKMVIEKVCNPKGKGAVMTGRVSSGVVKVGDPVEVAGMDRPMVSATVTSIESFRSSVPEAKSKMDVGIIARGVNKDNVVAGMVVVPKGKTKLVQEFKVLFKSNSEDEGGRSKPFKVGFEPMCYIREAAGRKMTCTVTKIEGADYVNPGDQATLDIKLNKPLSVFNGDLVILKETTGIVGSGKVIEVV